MTDELAQAERAITHWVREQMSRLSTPESRTIAKTEGRAALEALVEIAHAAQDVVATTRITEDGTFVSEGAARNLAAAVARLQKENE